MSKITETVHRHLTVNSNKQDKKFKKKSDKILIQNKLCTYVLAYYLTIQIYKIQKYTPGLFIGKMTLDPWVDKKSLVLKVHSINKYKDLLH